MKSTTLILILAIILPVTVSYASGWNDFVLDIGDGYAVLKWNNMDVCIGKGDYSLILCPQQFEGVGPVVGYMTSPDYIFTKNSGRKLSKNFTGDTFEDIDLSKKFFFIIKKGKDEVIGPMSENIFNDRSELKTLTIIDWKTPKDPNFWHPLLGGLVSLALSIIVGAIKLYWVTLPACGGIFFVFRYIKKKSPIKGYTLTTVVATLPQIIPLIGRTCRLSIEIILLNLKKVVGFYKKNSKKIDLFALLLTIATVIYAFSQLVRNITPKDQLLSFIYPSFYIKLIDQHNNPIEGVKIDATHGQNYWIGSNMSFGTYLSDKNGYVGIKKDGRGISIKKISASGYEIDYGLFLYNFEQSRQYNRPAEGDFLSEDLKHNSIEKPFLIKAWKIEKERNKAVFQDSYRHYRLQPDRRLYSINLLNPTPKSLKEGESNAAQIIFRYFWDETTPFLSDRSIIPIGNHSWEYQIIIPDGGIQESHDIYHLLAPENGYASSWKIDNHDFIPERGPNGSPFSDVRHFYVKFEDGMYSRLTIRFSPCNHESEKHLVYGIIELDYSINLSGTRFVNDFQSFYISKQKSK